MYKRQVKTVYNNGEIVSPAAFTQALTKDMYTRVTLNIKTNTPTNEAKGAQVVLTNIDGNSEHIDTGTTDASGKIVFSNIWKGTYDINNTLKGLNKYTAESEDFSTENSYEKYD